MTGTTAVFSANVGSIGWTVNGRMKIGQVIVYLMLLYLSLQRSDPIPVTGSLRPWPPRRLGTPAAQRTGRAADLPPPRALLRLRKHRLFEIPFNPGGQD